MASKHAASGPAFVALDGPAPPAFPDSEYGDDMIELGAMTPSTSASTSPPPYEAAAAASSGAYPAGPRAFVPTLSLQIQTPGKALLAFPTPPRPDPIPVYAVGPAGDLGAPAYVSLRPARGSGNCYLVRGDDAAETPLCATTYRFGPGRPPILTLFLGGAPVDPAELFSSRGSSSSSSSSSSPEAMEITAPSLLSRAQRLKTPHGTFEWRYAPRRERQAHDADSLLVLERVVAVATAGGGSEELRTRVAQLVRNDRFRSPGSGRSTAGNGGRLLLDLRPWADAKADRHAVEVLVVASCLCMLKKEVDRRRMHQIMVMSGAGSGGP